MVNAIQPALVNKIAELAIKGATHNMIHEELGISVRHVRDIARCYGIDIGGKKYDAKNRELCLNCRRSCCSGYCKDIKGTR